MAEWLVVTSNQIFIILFLFTFTLVIIIIKYISLKQIYRKKVDGKKLSIVTDD